MKEKVTLEFPNTFKVISLIKSPNQYNVEDLIKVIGTKIFNYTNATIIVQYNDQILDKFSTKDCKLQALLDKTSVPHTYNLFLRTRLSDRLEYIICHEMKHFDQYEKGDLNIYKDNSEILFIWKNTKYDSSINYWSRPWEKEARISQYELWKQFKKIYYI